MNQNKKSNFIKEATANKVDTSEINCRFAAFEAISLAINGKQNEAEKKLQEMDSYMKNERIEVKMNLLMKLGIGLGATTVLLLICIILGGSPF